MSYVAPNPEAFEGKTIGDGQCVAYVKDSAGCPATSKWVEGAKVKGNTNIPKGTAIATFEDGKYKNKTDGSSHAAIYIGQDKNGLTVYDQWLGQPVHKRIIRFKNGEGKRVNDGDAFSIIESSTVLRALALARSLSYDQVKALVEANNKAINPDITTELVVSLIWKESGFDPLVKNGSTSATGLMQITKDAVRDVNNNTPQGTHYEHSEMTDPAKNIQCGTYYLNLRVKWAEGDLKKGLEGFGTGRGYADNILKCRDCLQKAGAVASECLSLIHD